MGKLNVFNCEALCSRVYVVYLNCKVLLYLAII